MSIPVIMPKQGQSVETCVIVEWYVKKGEPVSKGDLLFTYETDKSSFDEEAPADGILLDIFYESGDEVPVLSNVAVIGEEGEDVLSMRPTVETLHATTVQKPEAGEQKLEAGSQKSEIRTTNPDSIGKQRTTNISPRAKKLADKMNISYSSIKGTGPNGRIIVEDIEKYVRVNTKHETLNTKTEDDWEAKKLSNVRQIIAKNIYASLQNSAQITHHLSADARKIIDYRKKNKKLYEAGKAPNITLNDLICFAVIKALKAKPEINAHFLGDSIRIFKKVHLGFAVDTERGLMVPVIRNADDLNIEELSDKFKELADSCGKGNIDPELLNSNSATFTVSNLGAYGIEMFTPIINLPQCGILGINTIIQRPVYMENGKIEIVPFVGLSLTYDHRAIDGAPASAFLKEVKEQIENLEIQI